MKTVYFVRHGSTEANQTKSYQSTATPLSEVGRKQAAVLADRFHHISFEVVISSDMERAIETSRIIALRTKRPHQIESLFREIARPSIVRGRTSTLPDVMEVMRFVSQNWTHRTAKYSDEENFFELKARALAALSYLEGRPEQRILVVTHGIFLRMLFCCMLAADTFGPELFGAVRCVLTVTNTGITCCEYKIDGWRVLTWNDHFHLRGI